MMGFGHNTRKEYLDLQGEMGHPLWYLQKDMGSHKGHMSKWKIFGTCVLQIY